jgi:thiol-disulfide isomerase/thioredoxin
MKNIILILPLIILMSCKSNKELNISVPYNDTVILLGSIDRNGFMQEPYSEWFKPNYKEYKIDNTAINELSSLSKDIQIVTFMGTWCGDSKRETPAFLKILDSIGFKPKKHRIYAVSREKTTPQQSEQGLNITNVPTFIFYKDGQELNRIVEYPIESLEKDMINILSGNDYKHAYAE